MFKNYTYGSISDVTRLHMSGYRITEMESGCNMLIGKKA